MTQATPKDYWISSTALYIELNALGNPDYIQASCVSGAQILVYVKDIIGYDAGHNYRRWPLQAAPTVFNSHTEKYVYAAIPRDMTLTASAWIVFPSELLDIYGKNEKAEQIGDERYYYIYLQGIITSSGDNGTEQRDWKQRVSTGLLSSDEAISAIGSDSEWYKYSSVDEIVTFLKDLTMKEGTTFKTLFADFINVQPKGSLSFDGQGALNGIANSLSTPDTNTDKIVTPNFVSARAISKLHDDTASGLITFLQGMALGSDGQWSFNKDGEGRLYRMFLNGDENVMVASNIASNNCVNDARTGFMVTDDDGTKYSYMEIDKLYVRYKAVFDELEIRKRTYVGGNAMFSDAASKIVGVEWLDKVGNTTTDITKIHDFKCHLKTDDGTTQTQNLWRVNDLALCQTFNIKENKDTGVQNKAYWRKVTAVGDDYICLSNVDGEYEGFGVDHNGDAAIYGTSAKVVLAGADGVVSDGDVLTDGADEVKVPADFPEAEDAIVQCGNASDPTRQNMIELLTYTPNVDSVLYGGGAAPALIQYAGINGFTLNGKAKTVISPSGNVFRAKSFIIDLGGDASVHVPLDMGEWEQGTEYPYYARVSHKGELWLLNGIIEGETTKEEPGTKNAWTRQVAKGKDGDGLNVKGTVVEHFKNFADFDANVKERPKEGEEDPHFVLVSGRVVGMNSAIIVDSAADYSEDHDGDIQQGTAKPSILTYTSDPIYDWDVAEASEADGYMDADGVLWVAGKTQWTEAGTIKGEKGDKGDDAEWYEVEIYRTPTSGNSYVIDSLPVTKDGISKIPLLNLRLVRHVGSTATTVRSGDTWEPNVGAVSGRILALLNTEITKTQLVVTATYNGKQYTKSIPVVKDGQTGDKGDDGEDAIDVLISPETLMFDTDDDGKLSGAQKTYITLRKGGVLLKPETDYTISQKTEGVNVEAEGITLDNTEQGYTITIDPTHITTYDIVDEQGNKTTYPYTDGYVAMVINVGGTLNLTKRVMFRVNYAKYVGKVSWTQKQFKSEFEKTTTDMNNAIANNTSLIAQNADAIKLKVSQKDMEGTMKEAGIDITSGEVVLMGDKIKLYNDGGNAPLVFSDGKLNADLINAKQLTSTGDNGAVVRIMDGRMQVSNKFGIVNMVFGLDDNGMAVMSYYDNNGNLLYDLGPNGISSSNLDRAEITECKVIRTTTIGLEEPFGEQKTVQTGRDFQKIQPYYVATHNNSRKLFANKEMLTGYEYELIYKYKAPRMNGVILPDTEHGLGGQLSKQADGMYFTSKTDFVDKDGNLHNLVTGEFFDFGQTVYDNTKGHVPVLVNGDSMEIGDWAVIPRYTMANAYNVIEGAKVAKDEPTICSDETMRYTEGGTR